jgi:hypothetical protein
MLLALWHSQRRWLACQGWFGVLEHDFGFGWVFKNKIEALLKLEIENLNQKVTQLLAR